MSRSNKSINSIYFIGGQFFTLSKGYPVQSSYLWLSKAIFRITTSTAWISHRKFIQAIIWYRQRACSKRVDVIKIPSALKF